MALNACYTVPSLCAIASTKEMVSTCFYLFCESTLWWTDEHKNECFESIKKYVCPCIHKNFMDHTVIPGIHDWWQQNPNQVLLVTSPNLCWLLGVGTLAAAPSRGLETLRLFGLGHCLGCRAEREAVPLYGISRDHSREISDDIGFSNHQIGEFTHHCFAGTRKDQGYSWVQPWFSGGWFQTCLKALNIYLLTCFDDSKRLSLVKELKLSTRNLTRKQPVQVSEHWSDWIYCSASLTVSCCPHSKVTMCVVACRLVCFCHTKYSQLLHGNNGKNKALQ